MRKQEIATVRVAVKRSIRANNSEAGYKYLEAWKERWKDTCDVKLVVRCFKMWVDRKQFMSSGFLVK